MKILNLTSGFRAVITHQFEITDEEAEEYKKEVGYPVVSSEYLDKTKEDLRSLLETTMPNGTDCQVSNFNIAYEIVEKDEQEETLQ